MSGNQLTSWRTSLDSDRSAFIAILLIAVIAFSPWWLAGRYIAPLDILHETFAPWNDGDTDVSAHNTFTSDAVTQYLIYRAFAARSFEQDGHIGWSDLTNAGRPEYANTMALYGDWTMQLHRFLDYWTAWHVGLLLQFIIAAVGMYVLLRGERIAPLVSLAGCVAYAGSTPFIFTLYHRWHLGAFAWVPWLVWAMLAFRSGRMLSWIAVPVFLALALVGGSLQTTVFVLLVLLSLWVGWLLDERRAAHRARLTAHMILWGVLGAGIAAFVLVPSVLTYLDAVDLHGGRSAIGYEHGVLQPIRALLFMPLQVVPTLLGSPRSMDLAKLFDIDLTFIAFFGFVPMLLAVCGAFTHGAPNAARVMLLLGLAIPLTPLVGPLYHRVQIVAVFGGVWLFAWYWQHGGLAWARRWRVAALLIGVLAATWLGASVLMTLFSERIDVTLLHYIDGVLADGGGGRLGGFAEWMRERALRLPRELMVWHPRQLLALAGVALGLLAIRHRREDAPRAALLMIAAIAIELGALTAGWVTTVDPRRYGAYPPRAELMSLQAIVGDGRVHVASTHDGPAPLLPPNTLAMYGIPTVQQYETVDMHGMWQRSGLAVDARTLGRLAVTHAVAAPGAARPDGWTRIEVAGSLEVWKNDFAVPHYLAVPAGRSAAAHLAAVQQHETGPTAVTPDSATFNFRRVTVPAGTAALRVAENWSEGWVYQISAGEVRPVGAAADGSMLIPLEPGPEPTTLEMRYQPARRTAGRAISFVSFVLLVPSWWLSRRIRTARA